MKCYATGSQSGRAYLVLLVLHELVDEVRADEARPTGDQDPQVGLDQTAIRHWRSGSGPREPARPDGEGGRSGGGDRALTWKNLEKRSGEGVGGGREVVCSPLLPLVSFCAIASRTWFRPDPTQTTRVRRQVKITHRNGAGPKAITQLRASEQRRSVGRAEGRDGDGARRGAHPAAGAGDWARLAWLGQTRGTGGLNRIRLGADDEEAFQI